jgi:hypothetical protein
MSVLFVAGLVWYRRGRPDADDGFGRQVCRSLAVARGIDGVDV